MVIPAPANLSAFVFAFYSPIPSRNTSSVLPQVVPFDFGEESINELDMVSAYCTVNKGDLPLDIAWTKNGGRVFTNDGVVVTRNSQRISVLSIESVRARHAGNYSCVATNNAGETRQSAMLAVNG